MSGSDKPPSSPRSPSVTTTTHSSTVTTSPTRTISSPTQTECTGSEPYYNVPVLQNVVSAAPGVTSRLYSVQVMTKSELDSLTHFQRQQLQQRQNQQQHSQQQTVSPCDSAMCSFNTARSSGHRSDDNYPTCDSTSSDSTSSHSRHHKSDKPVNLSSKK